MSVHRQLHHPDTDLGQRWPEKDTVKVLNDTSTLENVCLRFCMGNGIFRAFFWLPKPLLQSNEANMSPDKVGRKLLKIYMTIGPEITTIGHN